MLSFCLWLQSTALFTDLRGSAIVYPAILSLHMVALAFFGCMILVTDLRLLGAGLRNYPVADLLDRLRTPKWIGFALMVTFGVLLFGAKAEEYYYNIFFRAKMIILALILIHGLAFRRGVYRNGAALDASGLTGTSKLAAALSITLWVGMAMCGRGIGYIEPPLFIHASAPARAAPRGDLQPVAPTTAARKTPWRMGSSRRLFGTPTVRKGRDQRISSRTEGARINGVSECFLPSLTLRVPRAGGFLHLGGSGL
ncbi:MAG TPA: DUF6644 family protein [Bryobacteraceae bacterium]|nr:DUF6644 family protein [Bryobacteraceae bacterium]